MSKLIGILIPAYNTEKYLAQAIDSVIHQSFQDWELLILDDASEDRTEDIARSFARKHANIRAIRNKTNLGMLNNWNRGVDLLTNKYFIKLDSDDLWHPEMLEKALNAIESDDQIGLVFSRYLNIDERGDFIPGSESKPPAFAINKCLDCISLVRSGEDKMLRNDLMRQGISLMRRDIFHVFGKYRYLYSQDTQACTDTEFYFRMGLHYKIYQMDDVLYYYRIHEDSISKTDHRKSLAAKKIFEVKNAIFDYYWENEMIDKDFYKETKPRFFSSTILLEFTITESVAIILRCSYFYLKIFSLTLKKPVFKICIWIEYSKLLKTEIRLGMLNHNKALGPYFKNIKSKMSFNGEESF